MAENFELNIAEPPKRQHNYFPIGHVPFNKGIPMVDWMDGRKIRKVMKCLELGRIKGHPELHRSNRKQIVGIKDGILKAFRDAGTAERYIRSLGIKVNRRNINKVCHGDDIHRKKAGGYQWFFSNEVESYKNLLK
jgi:hypothetical protein